MRYTVDINVSFQIMMDGLLLETAVDVHETAVEVHEIVVEVHETDVDAIETCGGTKSMAKELTEKSKPRRTEPLSSYACYVQEVKKKVGKAKLNMTTVNLTWKTMDTIQKDYFRELSRLDKLSLGDNYRKRPVRGVKRIRKEVKKPKKKLDETKNNSVKIAPSVSGLVEKVKDLDKETANSLYIKDEQYQKLLKLKIDGEVKVRELGDIDSLIMSYQKKCEALIKKNRII